MRRPAPLPAPLSAPPRRPSGPPERDAAEPDSRDGTMDATGPVIPLEAAAATDATPAASTSDLGGVDGTVGVRDVWRAARARRRALRAEVRRFTGRQRRRRAIWISVGVAFALLIAGSFGAAYSPLFAVQKIEVVGTHTLTPSQIESALSSQLGTPLPLVDAAAVKAALVHFPLVETYTLQARPPHELVVRIVERTPVGVVKGPAGYTLVDAAGVALSTTATAPKGEPVLSVGPGVDSDAFRAAGMVIRSLPDDVRALVTAVSASTPDDVTLTLGKSGSKVVWGSDEDSGRKGIVLQALMKRYPTSTSHTYDVSSPDAVLVN